MKFHSLRNNLNNTTSQSDFLNIKELISKLDIMFEKKLSQTFKDILILPRNKFLDIIISQVKQFLDEQFGDDIYKNEKFINFFSSSCNNLEDKYNTYLDELNQVWDNYYNKKNKINDNSFFFTKFRKHCIKTENFAMHKCSENEIGYYIISQKKIKKGIGGSHAQSQYLICNKCKTVYFTDNFLNFCKDCNENYLSSALNHNEDPELLLATWKQTHCDTLVNEKIKCKKCKNNFLYLNMKLNRLQCKNKSCTYNEIPYNIEWNCYICNKPFYSNVKIYNPVEVQQIKDIIKFTLLLKKKAHPTKISCCKNIDVLTQNFFHKKECQGLLYFGEYNSRIIIVCEKCKAINFLIKFIWTCPICGIRFKDKSTFNNNINDGKKQKIYNSNYKEEKNKNDKENNDEEKRMRSNKSYGRRNKETLISLLRRRSELSLEKDLNKNESGNKIDRKLIENNSKTFNIRSIKYEENKENTNLNIINNNNLRTIKLDSNDIDKTSKNSVFSRRELKKSLSESKNIQNTYKRSSYFEKKMSNIEPIKEENDLKNNSPQKQQQNISNTKLRENTIQNEEDFRHKSKRIYFKNEEKKRDNCLSPRMKNSIFNKYLRYSNGANNIYNHEDNIKTEKNLVLVVKRKNSGENKEKNDMHKNNNNIKYQNSTLNKNEENNKQKFIHGYKEKPEENNFTNGNFSEQNNSIINERGKRNEKKLNEINQKSIYYKSNNETTNINKNYNINSLSNYVVNNKNNMNKTSAISDKLCNNRTQNRYSTQENIINKDNTSNKWYKNKLLVKENNINIAKEQNNNIENKPQINTIKIMKKKNENIEVNKDNEKSELIKTFRHRSRYRIKVKENEENKKINEENKKNDENKNEINNLCLNMNENKTNRRDNYKERIKTFNTYKDEDFNKDKKERKTVKSRKELLKEKEKEKINNNNLFTEKKEKEAINKLNLNTLEKNEYKRYTNHQIYDSHQETIKTKENTISRYTKDSYTSKENNNIIRINNYTSTYDSNNNNPRNKETNNNKDNNNEKNAINNIKEIQKLNEKGIKTEIKPIFHTKKTRKDYLNDRNKKLKETATNEKSCEMKSFIPAKKESLTRTSYQTNKRSNIILNNIGINLDKEEDIPIFDKDLRKDKIKYNQIQYQLKLILARSCLPKFNIDYYIIKNQIGTGSFGVIFQVYNIKTRCKFALKKIFAPDISTLQKFVNEFELVHQNPHNNILDLIGVCIQCVDITNYILYVLMDLAEKDWDKEINYRAKIKKYYNENELLNILKQLNSALYFLQKDKKIAHRDIKPENILIFKNDVYKIGDFGEAKENKIPKQFSTLRGTELYMSPLLYNGYHDNKEDVKHNQFKSDMFSLGYCFIYAASLKLDIIFKIRDINNIFSLRKILIKEFGRRYSEKFIELILKMIDYNEEKRIDFIELDRILREEF